MLHLALFHEYNTVLSIFLPVFQTMSFLWRPYSIILYFQFRNFPLFYIFGRDISSVSFVISFFLYPLVILVFFHKFTSFNFFSIFSMCSKCSSNVFEYIIISSMYTTTNSSNQSFSISFIIL